MSGVGYYKADEVRRAANGRWVDVLARCGVNAQLLENKHGPCPGCGGRDRFRYDDKDGEGTWLCSQGGGGMISGDGIALLMHVTGKEWKDCLGLVGDVVLGEAGQHKGRLGGTARNPGVVREPRAREAWIPEFSFGKLQSLVRGTPAVEEEWFMERSAVDPQGLTPGEYLEHVFATGERVLVFTEFRSQGDFLWEVGRGGYRLSSERGVRAVRSALPTDGGAEGVWYLSNPVDGAWYPNPRQKGKWSRRSEESVTGWRHLVLECDESKTLKKRAMALKEAGEIYGRAGQVAAKQRLVACGGTKWAEEMMERRKDWPEMGALWIRQAPLVPGLWLRFLAMAPLAIRAIYSSGGDSMHALVDVGMEDKASFDAYLRASAKKFLPAIGADPVAMTPVRLTRLPGCTRKGRLQRLIYLNPSAKAGKAVPIVDQMKRREVAR